MLGRYVLLAAALVGGCAGKVDYIPPGQHSTENTKEIAKSKDAVWDQLIPGLSKQFFVVNTIEKVSGLINISYAGNPAKYVDCGRIHSYVKNARGERNYDFDAAEASANYETFTNNALIAWQRRVTLDGRMNIVVTVTDPTHSTVAVNTRYILTISANGTDVNGRSAQASNTITFNTGGVGTGLTITCKPNGQFERDVLDLVS